MTLLYDESPVERERNQLKEENKRLTSELFVIRAALGNLVDAIETGKDPRGKPVDFKAAPLTHAKKILGRD
jgi:hypothetical protein